MNALHALLTCLQEYQFRLFWAELLFMLYLPRRSKYPLRLLVWLPFLFLPLLFGNAFDADFFRIGSYTWSFLAWFAYSLFAVAFCHKTDAGTFVFVAVSAYALQNLFADFRYFMLFAWFGEDTLLYSAAGLLLLAFVYAAAYLLFVRSWAEKLKLELKVNKISLLAIAAFILLVLNVLSSFMVNNVADNAAFADICLLFGLCTFVTVLLLMNVYDKSYIQYEKETMDRMLFEQDRQRKLSEETIDLINMKCHDMKHQIAALREGGAAANEEFFQKTVDSISIYDSYFNTGNRSLDLVLTEKSLLCQKSRIRFTCIADGAALGFMSTGDIYSFFGNALDNAVECVRGYAEDRRNISLHVRRAGECVSISVDNYCGEKLAFAGGLPVTTKKDKNFHGFGTKSMRYIVEELYGGNLVMRQTGDVFSVAAMIPIPAPAEGGRGSN